MISEEKKLQYWNHFTSEFDRVFRPKKITDVRLKFVKKEVFDDDSSWDKIVGRYHAISQTPDELKAESPTDYCYARANFWAMVRGKIECQRLNEAREN